MNSEELEQSLRTEFEGYLKNILADMTQEVSQFQQKIDTELEKHKSHLDDVFQEFSTRIQNQRELDEGFKESVVEHLRLARDEGARITATAIAEAEELTKSEQKTLSEVEPSFDLSDIRDAINDISSQNSQSSILKSLITHAAKFTPRGAFFVVKNQHFVGWRVFGKEENISAEPITDIIFPVSASTILGESVSSLGAIESSFGAYPDDAEYLNQLNFSDPGSIFAIPLIARGRGVAAIYADNGDGNDTVNLEALETLVNVAGLTVELLAAAQSSNYSREPAKASSFVAAPQTVESSEESEPDASVEEHYGEQEVATEAESTAVETDSGADVESGDVYDDAEYDVSEEEAVSADEETGVDLEESADEEESYQISEPSEDAAVYQTAEELEAPDEAEIETAELVDTEELEIQSAESSSNVDQDSSMVDDDSDFAVYDDDLIEEVQTRSTVEADEVHETEEGEDETIEEVGRVAETYAAEADSSIYEAEVEAVVPSEVADDIAEPVQETQVESGEEFDSASVQFESPEEAVESDQPSTADVVPLESGDSDDIEEVSFTEPAAVEAEEFSAESFAEEVSRPVETVAPPAMKTRFSDRNLDLPIEVGEDERRLHNDARRFARLLVSEIKLYNEQKVKEGRQANDLYDRLREALDRSREMYDKRVQPAVVERFDYFHFEVVNTLAEGEESKLGATYPGAAVPV